MQRLASRIAVALGAAAMLLLVSGGSAVANEFYTGGTTSSITNFTTGSTTYTQTHGGDDFAFDVTSGIAVDMRWVKCSDTSVRGSIKYNIGSDGYRVLGTNFLVNTCLRIQYRGYTQTGSFNGWTFWNYNFA